MEVTLNFLSFFFEIYANDFLQLFLILCLSYTNAIKNDDNLSTYQSSTDRKWKLLFLFDF